ncbi:MAG: type II secretion system F family protein [Patescibacteria group bacterium]|nr:type II secretion system F family protein [Patescibacteria group bacterium]
MPTFLYAAINNQGEISNGELETIDTKAVKDYLNRQELTAISIKPKKNSSNKFSNIFSSSISQQDKIMLTKHLSTMIRSGLNLKEGIETILNDAKKNSLKKILTDAKFNLEKGQQLSTTFKKYPNSFSNIFITLIESGEASGTLEKSLEYLGIQEKKDYKLRQKVKGAMIYPAVLIFASILVIILMMVFVVPKLAKSFQQNNIKLPWTTQFIMNLSDFITANFFIIISLLFIIPITLFYFRKKEKFQQISSEIILKMPVISDLYIKIILARFIRTLGTLLASGISILKSLNISAGTLGYNRYQKSIKDISKDVSRGVSMSNALKKRKDLFPYMLINMVSVGEKTGNLELTLSELAIFYEEEVDNNIKNFVSLMEPLILGVMGIIVAVIAFSIIMPIYQLVGSI